MDSSRGPETASMTLAWFPLVQRSRPPALSLQTRISQLQQLAAYPNDSGGHLAQAAEVCNKAALIASDCGMPDLARALCWRQYEVFDKARPLPASAAKLALQPLLNIPRQLIRQGDGEKSYAILEALYHAARDQTSAVIDDRSVNLRNVTCAVDDRKTVSTLVWAALLADGARALALAGRWREAAERLAAHRGVGVRLLDGRQVTILALLQDGQAERAATLVEQSAISEPWEKPVQDLLRVCSQRAARVDVRQHIAVMLHDALGLLQQSDPATAVFRARVGMSALDLADSEGEPQQVRLCSELIAAAQGDAYVAREVLAHPRLRLAMTDGQQRDLGEVVYASGFGRRTIPRPLRDDLMAAVSLAERRLRTLLGCP